MTMQRVWQRCEDAGMEAAEFAELTGMVAMPAIERLPENKLWIIPLCVIKSGTLCKMRFMCRSIGEFVEAIHNDTMEKIRDMSVQSGMVDEWMDLLVGETGLESMEAIMYGDWNIETPVIRLSGEILRRRASAYLLASATVSSVGILYESTMVGPASTLNLRECTDDNPHELLTRV